MLSAVRINPNAVAETTSSTRGLRNLYCVRFGFAIVWAGLLALTASTLTPATIACTTRLF
ncbi:hypothetical protein RW1_070_00010 [Rhodococcus wratislaviensis NBRC 100605]|uniref:Uncharacterized protein n=1 Tax=Rhodococcus wratislaviensis NBRC 100605 TaxID=1219028 RepID=X0RDQ1_RHOWR|nr:hypothetical protein RW1_070_00010 [Rhodococcus wratislaviensis NBRC 100605]